MPVAQLQKKIKSLQQNTVNNPPEKAETASRLCIKCRVCKAIYEYNGRSSFLQSLSMLLSKALVFPSAYNFSPHHSPVHK